MSKENSLMGLVLAPILYAVTLPTTIALIFLNEICRGIVRLVLWFRYGHGITLIEDGLDAVFHYKNNCNTRNVTVVGILEDKEGTQFDIEKYAKDFENKILLHEEVEDAGWPFKSSRRYRPYEKLEKILTTSHGYYCWKYDDSFNIHRHFRVLDSDKIYTEKDVRELCSTLTLDMDESKPQWEFVFVPKYQNDKGEMKRVQIFNFHHSYMDGLSLLMLLNHHLLDKKVPLQLNPLTIKIPLWKQVLYYLNGLIYGPSVLLSIFLNKNKSHWIENSSPKGKKIFAWTSPIDLAVVKKIRVKTTATIPNIVAQAYVKAIKDVLPKERVIDTLKWGEILAFVPYKNADPQNRFTLFSYPVSTQDLTGSSEEFRKTVSKLRRDRSAGLMGPQPLIFYYIFKICCRFPCFTFSDALDLGQASLYLSNVPTFTDKISYFGSTCEEFCPFPPMPNKTGVILASISYANHIQVSGAADVSWFTEEELQKVFKEIPKIIHAMADTGCIPHEMPEPKVVDEILQVEEVKEEKEEVDPIPPSQLSQEDDADSSSEEEEDAEAETDESVEDNDKVNVDDMVTTKLLSNGRHESSDDDDDDDEDDSMDENKNSHHQEVIRKNEKNEQMTKQVMKNGNAKFNGTKTEIEQDEMLPQQNGNTSGVH